MLIINMNGLIIKKDKHDWLLSMIFNSFDSLLLLGVNNPYSLDLLIKPLAK
jgi:hypothetical protein